MHIILFPVCESGGTGRREGLKIPWPQGRAGSIPASRTTLQVHNAYI